MNTPGVLISGVIAILAALNRLRWLTYFAFFRGHLPSSVPPLAPLAMGAVFAAFAVWGVSTGIALFWHKRWARISIQVFGVALALLSLLSGFGGIVGLRALIAQNPGPAAITLGLAQIVIYPIQIAVAVWWLVLFNTRSVKTAFGDR